MFRGNDNILAQKQQEFKIFEKEEAKDDHFVVSFNARGEMIQYVLKLVFSTMISLINQVNCNSKHLPCNPYVAIFG